jgi:hypothetical protein
MDDGVRKIETANDDGRTTWRRVRNLIGVVMLLAIGVIVLAANADVDAAREGDASAIQIIQVWTPNIFYMITVIGIGIAFYIITRIED